MRRVLTPAFATLFVFLAVPCRSQPEPAISEKGRAVRAAYVYNFTQFVTWPRSAAGGPFRACVVSRTGIADKFLWMEAKSVSGRRIAIKRVDSRQAAENADCDLAYVDVADARRYLASVRGRPILTIGEGSDFLGYGGMIAFDEQGGAVVFSINQEALELASMSADPQLLEVAVRVLR